MATRQTRIFQIAKDLNISHTEILTFLKNKGVEVSSHMSPVDKHTQDMIQAEFHKEREDIDRFRKEQVRREIHQTRIDEQQKSQKKWAWILSALEIQLFWAPAIKVVTLNDGSVLKDT